MTALRTTILTKVVNAPLKFVFNWCTDYQESDPKITGSKRRRVILDRSKKRVVFAAVFDEDDGKTHVSVYDVKLKPPDSWHYDIFDSDRIGTGDYKLKHLSNKTTQLRIVFKNKYKNVAKKESSRAYINRLNGLWDKYIATLEKDYAGK